MSRLKIAACLLVTLVVASPLAAHYLLSTTGKEMTLNAERFLKTLKDDQRTLAVMDYDSPKRVDWHFIPKNDRKGLQLRDMTDAQRSAAHDLLKSCLSKVGYDKATKIMELEKLLHELETRKNANVNVRDTLRYYFTIFGNPEGDGRWGLSVEGHHMSLNFVVEKEIVLSSSPMALCTNPAIVKTEIVPSIPSGRRVLAKEETLGFDLLASLNDEQRKAAVLSDKAPKEIRAAGEAQPPTEDAVGLPAAKMNADQKKILKDLVDTYCENVPGDIAAERLDQIKTHDFDNIYFCWMGPDKAGIGHYYRLQGPSFLVELVNTQPDADGNPANHVHCIWRDMHGDFAIPITK